MKTRILSIVSTLLVCVMAIGMVIEHHHHLSDGSLCLCLSIDCHSTNDCDGHSGHGCTHDHSQENGDCDCSLHIDEFCYNNAGKAKILVQCVDLMVTPLMLNEIDKCFVVNQAWHRPYNEPLRKFLLTKHLGLRAPPTNDVLLC